MIQPHQHPSYFKQLRPMTLPGLIMLALTNRQLVSAHSSIKMMEEYSGGSIHIVASHARYILNQFEQRGYVEQYLDNTQFGAKNFRITEYGKQRLNEEIRNLHYIHTSVAFLASF